MVGSPADYLDGNLAGFDSMGWDCSCHLGRKSCFVDREERSCASVYSLISEENSSTRYKLTLDCPNHRADCDTVSSLVVTHGKSCWTNKAESHHILVVEHLHKAYVVLGAFHNFHGEVGIARPWDNPRARQR